MTSPSSSIPPFFSPIFLDNLEVEPFFKDEGIFFILGKIEKFVKTVFIFICKLWYKLNYPELANIPAPRPFYTNPAPQNTQSNSPSPTKEIDTNILSQHDLEANGFIKYLRTTDQNQEIPWTYYPTISLDQTTRTFYGFVENATKESEILILDNQGHTLSFMSCEKNKDPKEPTLYEYLPDTHQIRLTWKDKHTKITEKLQYPWMQEFAFSLLSFIQSPEKEIYINTIQPKTSEVRVLKITKTGNEEITLQGHNYKTIKITSEAMQHLWGSDWNGSKFWNATEWYDEHSFALLQRKVGGLVSWMDPYPKTLYLDSQNFSFPK